MKKNKRNPHSDEKFIIEAVLFIIAWICLLGALSIATSCTSDSSKCNKAKTYKEAFIKQKNVPETIFSSRNSVTFKEKESLYIREESF